MKYRAIITIGACLCLLQITHASDYVSDSIAVRAILDSNSFYSIDVQDVTTTRNARITSFKLYEAKTLSHQIGDLVMLDTLELEDHYLTDLPPEIGNLTNLKVLSLSCALVGIYGERETGPLQSLPSEIGKLRNLRVFSVHTNELKSLPSSIGGLTQLKRWILTNNHLTELPSEIGNLENLEYLSLSGNLLKSVPPDIGHCKSLTELGLGCNRLKSLPVSIGDLTQLKKLWVYGNQVESLPESVGKLVGLATLDLSGNALTCLPESIVRISPDGKKYPYGHLCVYDNRLCELDSALGTWIDRYHTTHAQYYSDAWQTRQQCQLLASEIQAVRAILDANRLYEMSIWDVVKKTENQCIVRLHLTDSLLHSIPKEIGNFSALKELHIGSSELAWISPEIGNLASLEELGIGSDKLINIPSRIGDLVNLKELYLRSASLRGIPPEIGNLVGITHFRLTGSPIETLPESITSLRPSEMFLDYEDYWCSLTPTVQEWIKEYEFFFISPKPCTEPRFTCPRQSSAVVGQPYKYKITFNNPTQNLVVLTYRQSKDTWWFGKDDTIIGIPNKPGSDTITAFLSVNALVYDTLQLVVTITDPVGIVHQTPLGYSDFFGFSKAIVQGQSVNFLIVNATNQGFVLQIYNASGRKIWSYCSKDSEKGLHKAQWYFGKATRPANGVYMAVLRQGKRQVAKKFTLLNY